VSKLKVVCPHCGAVNAIPLKDHYAKAACGQCKISLLKTKPITLDSDSFDNHVANSDIPVVVDFWAPWCGPCQMMAPSFEEAAESFPLKARFAKVNTEEQQAVAARFGIRSIPTVIVFKNNRETDRMSGTMTSVQIKEWVSQFI
jgi:thioredoxin 2